MKHSFYIIFYMMLMIEIISLGCRSKHPDGTTSREEINQIDRYGRKQGPWKIYTDGILIAEGSYLDGQPDGLWTYRYQNGQLKEEGRYHKGVKNGMWIEWYQDGALMWKGEWEKGKRYIGYPYEKAEIKFIGEDPPDNVLNSRSIYHLRIRIVNIPISNLFVEVNNGSITGEEESDLFILHTPSDTVLTLAIGYIPDLAFKDLRNLVKEVDFTIR
jgi:hypothetical protein